MPFIEVFAPEAGAARRPAAVHRLTDALCRAFEIEPRLVSIFFLNFGESDYAQGGTVDPEKKLRGVFLKVHALRRSIELRRTAARLLTQAVCEVYGTPNQDVAIYFLERTDDEVAHGGRLMCDG